MVYIAGNMGEGRGSGEYVAVTECNKNWKVVRRPGNGDLEFKSARVCSYIRVSEGEGEGGMGGLGPRSFALGPWSPVWGVGLGGSWSFALGVGVGVPKRGWWHLKRVWGLGVRGPGRCDPSPGRLKRA